ncbi:MAG: NADH-quinone oxidoreductase subunit [Frankiales bacterium]|nr:NADH-quinone oxidoreductase subunit [Frankiales bacterium]
MSLVQHVDGLALAPPTALALTAAAVLVVDLLVRRRRVELAVGVGLLGTAVALVFVAVLARGEPRATFCLTAHACSYEADGFALALQGLVLLALAVVLPLLTGALRDHRLPPGEAVFLLLSSATGAMVMAAGRDVITLVVALELVSLPTFVLVGLRRGDPRSAEAALKAFLIGVVSTALTLYGASLLYGVTGSLHLDLIAEGLSAHRHDPLAAAAVVLVVAGFGFKVAAVPFHFWVPDAYSGAPLPVAAYLAVVSKAAGFAGLLLLLLRGLAPYVGTWGPVLGVLAALTMSLGNLLALRQRTVIRLLAWSSVAQAGYMLVPLALHADAGRKQMQEASTATLGYLGFYAAMTLGAFAAASVLARSHGALTIEASRGLVRVAPWTAGVLVLSLASLAGLPPGVGGLVAKVVVLRSAVDAGYTWLAVVMAVNTVIALAYYLRWAVVALSPGAATERPFPPARAAVGAALAAGAATVVVSVVPQLVMRAAAGGALG